MWCSVSLSRRLVTQVAVGLICLPALAAHRIPVAQLEQDLSAACAEHRTDADIAHMVSNMELSQRLTEITLGRLAAKLPIQPQTAVALELLADQSAFLDPPPSEIPATEPPDAATQQRILDLARGYVVQTISRLPNFFATRTVRRFDDSPQVLHSGGWPVRAGLHLVGSASRTVTFSDGKEVVDTVTETEAAKPDLGLYSYGEFGPVLARTLTDLVKGKVQFSHWEDTPIGVAAVYRFDVPKPDSHYQVHFCCIVNKEYVTDQFYNSRSGQIDAAQNVTRKPFDATPAYHGSLSIDPSTGAIVRIAIQAELSSSDPIERAATVVEYGRVFIGGQTFICPVRSLALSVQQPPYTPGVFPQPPSTLLINESTFTDYHRLGSSSRMIADGSVPAGTAQPDQPISAESAPSGPVPAPAPTGPETPSATQTASQPVPAAKQLAESAPPATQPPPAAPPAAPVIPEISTTNATSLPDIANTPANTGYSLKVTSRLVDIGVVALDKKGRPVTDLNPADFEIYDNGRKQDIRSFSAPATSSQPEPLAPPATADRTFSNRAPDSAAAPSAAAAADTPSPSASAGTVLLIDESHIAWSDLNNARSEMLKFLAKAPADAPIGLYTMNGLGFHVLLELTADHGAIEARLKAFLPTAQSVSDAQDEERRNRQTFEYVHNVNDLNSVNGNHIDVPDDPAQPIDYELLTKGDNPAGSAFIVLAQVARHLSAIPGHKNLVWVSSDNVFADWEDQAVGIDKSPNAVAGVARHAEEAMNEAHAAVYPFDVSQIEGGAIGAELENSSVELTPAAQDNATLAASAGVKSSSSLPPPSNRSNQNGRIDAQVSQDVHPIQGPVRDVAAGTGGRTIRRSSDLAAALEGIVEDGRATYQLSFTPAGMPDGQYHAIVVKLTGRRRLTLRYRTGYLFAIEPESLKDRFRQAVWQPSDTSEIGVAASVSASGAGDSVNVKVAAADLAMQQHAGRWMDKLDIFFIQRDDAGIHARVDGQVLGLRLKPSTYQNIFPTGVPFQRAVEMQPGMASLRVLVVDENSGRMGSVTIPSQSISKPGQQASGTNPTP